MYEAAPNWPASFVQPGTAPNASTAVMPAPPSAPGFLIRFLPQTAHAAPGAADATVASAAAASTMTPAKAILARVRALVRGSS